MSKSTGGDKRVKSNDGNTYIPATQRPDGTWRKAVKVKEGYVPADEQPRYQCKAQIQATQRDSGSKFPIGYTPKALQNQANAIKEQRKQQQLTSQPVLQAPQQATESKSTPITPQDHVQKKINGLRKKLDDIDKLKKRIDNGELPNPEKNQLEKLERKPQLLEEINKLTEELNELKTS
ncbi:Partner of Y14 and mago [Aphelenchoides bicaudatus]|nr:Partner of Y14 and mago [Aphelenchoides bicaudatus]